MKESENKNITSRLIFVQVVLIVLIFLLGARSIDIQIFQAEELAEKAIIDHSKDLIVKGERGQIFDREMNPLATSMPATSISACPAQIKQPERVAGELSRILGIKKEPLEKKFSSDRMFAPVARSVSNEQADRIRELNLIGIYFEDDFKRRYPQREVAAQIIGFTNSNDVGLEGLEYKYNKTLEGKNIKRRFIRDGNGLMFSVDKEQRSQLQGNSIVLTIDRKIQYLSERTLEQTVKTFKADSGIAVVMKPRTGELLAIAHYPLFNPNAFANYGKQLFRNRAVTDAFEPGSAMKVFTAAAALERGFDPKRLFFCENGSYRIGSYTIHDTHPNDLMSINQIIKHSSNIGAAKITETIGDKALYQYLVKFGFGRKTNIDCPGEATGLLKHYMSWSRIDAGTISFGQGISVSAIQLTSAISAIANDGVLMKPMLVKKIISGKGDLIKENHPQVVCQAVSKRTAGQLKRMMNLVVSEDGTGAKAAMDGYSVCGKTGTAQKALKNKKGYAKGKYISVFTGFAPEKNPELAILVIVDEPKEKYYGGDVAAPAFKTIMAESFNYLNIPPEKNRSMIAMASQGEKK